MNVEPHKDALLPGIITLGVSATASIISIGRCIYRKNNRHFAERFSAYLPGMFLLWSIICGYDVIHHLLSREAYQPHCIVLGFGLSWTFTMLLSAIGFVTFCSYLVKKRNYLPVFGRMDCRFWVSAIVISLLASVLAQMIELMSMNTCSHKAGAQTQQQRFLQIFVGVFIILAITLPLTVYLTRHWEEFKTTAVAHKNSPIPIENIESCFKSALNLESSHFRCKMLQSNEDMTSEEKQAMIDVGFAMLGDLVLREAPAVLLCFWPFGISLIVNGTFDIPEGSWSTAALVSLNSYGFFQALGNWNTWNRPPSETVIAAPTSVNISSLPGPVGSEIKIRSPMSDVPLGSKISGSHGLGSMGSSPLAATTSTVFPGHPSSQVNKQRSMFLGINLNSNHSTRNESESR